MGIWECNLLKGFNSVYVEFPDKVASIFATIELYYMKCYVDLAEEYLATAEAT